MNIQNKKRSLGQGMTEYIIIVALIAIAAIGVYTAFGDVVRGQTGAMAAELGGVEGATGAALAATGAGEGNTKAVDADLSNFSTQN